MNRAWSAHVLLVACLVASEALGAQAKGCLGGRLARVGLGSAAGGAAGWAAFILVAGPLGGDHDGEWEAMKGKSMLGGAAVGAVLGLHNEIGKPCDEPKRTHWRVPAVLGAGLIGAGLGFGGDVLLWGGTECWPCAVVMPLTKLGIIGGVVAGRAIGARADERLARGDSLSDLMRGTLRLLTFAAPITVGSIIAYGVVLESEGRCYYHAPQPYCTRPVLTDETVMALGVGTGAALGFALQFKLARAMHPRSRVSVLPTSRGVQLAYQLTW